MKLHTLDLKIISWVQRHFSLLARTALFIVYFYFGFLKLFGLSPATPLAAALTERTIGLEYFDTLYILLSAFECVIGILFLFPKATRVVIPMLLVHIALVSAPLVLLTDLVWLKPLVPTLEGQYIIKNAAIVALALGIAATLQPLGHKKAHK